MTEIECQVEAGNLKIVKVNEGCSDITGECCVLFNTDCSGYDCTDGTVVVENHE